MTRVPSCVVKTTTGGVVHDLAALSVPADVLGDGNDAGRDGLGGRQQGVPGARQPDIGARHRESGEQRAEAEQCPRVAADDGQVDDQPDHEQQHRAVGTEPAVPFSCRIEDDPEGVRSSLRVAHGDLAPYPGLLEHVAVLSGVRQDEVLPGGRIPEPEGHRDPWVLGPAVSGTRQPDDARGHPDRSLCPAQPGERQGVAEQRQAGGYHPPELQDLIHTQPVLLTDLRPHVCGSCTDMVRVIRNPGAPTEPAPPGPPASAGPEAGRRRRECSGAGHSSP